MAKGNGFYRTKLRQLDAQVRQLELKMAITGAPAARPALEELRIEREVYNLILLNRKVEAARPIVNFWRWRDANGAVRMVGAEPGGGRSAALAS
jgi:hypothetical protein